LDEFQDTANVQWENFRPLLSESDSRGGENLIVGDVKQSIYRWRGSDWKLLDEKIPNEFPDFKEEVLDTNYRSLPNVVDFNNRFFAYSAEILDKIAGYGEDGPMQRIYSDVEQEIAKNGEGSVELTFCPKESELEEVLKAVQKAREAGARLSDIADWFADEFSENYELYHEETEDSSDEKVLRASANIKAVSTIPAEQINTYDIVKNAKLVITAGAVAKIQEAYEV
jgi:ATP-dependent exoDNAse (exonuclease V) beta subunit